MQKNRDQKHWETVAHSYNAFWRSKAKQELSKKELNFINSFLNKTKGRYILDIGVGSGRIIDNYLKESSAKEIYGVDWAKSMVEFCRNRFKNDRRVRSIKVCNISSEKLPFNQKFDFISAIRVLKYNSNWQAIIGNYINKLTDNGVFVFTMPNKNSFLRFTKPETSIYSTTRTELERTVRKQKGEIIKITSFMKLPDVFYDISDNSFYVSTLLQFEKILRNIFGETFLSRIFFISIKPRL
ncbi:class I SAM-dependent methyltransferase [Candidatus Daviesbacteria bacterium]|nr:class I SAM-dependent methyltransferase [Candidatus Daviesbacteria bacterium]